ncbi:MAG: hypothetical protein IID39_06665 [Planctomycetes bacterium]|nr:hypothetical protein [Planctomycetota bacterium]
MRPEDVREHLDRRPFEAFRICMSDGETFDVSHPDLCIVARSTIYVGVPDPKRRLVAVRVVHCALIHITRIEPLDGRPRRARRRRT